MNTHSQDDDYPLLYCWTVGGKDPPRLELFMVMESRWSVSIGRCLCYGRSPTQYMLNLVTYLFVWRITWLMLNCYMLCDCLNWRIIGLTEHRALTRGYVYCKYFYYLNRNVLYGLNRHKSVLTFILNLRSHQLFRWLFSTLFRWWREFWTSSIDADRDLSWLRPRWQLLWFCQT